MLNISHKLRMKLAGLGASPSLSSNTKGSPLERTPDNVSLGSRAVGGVRPTTNNSLTSGPNYTAASGQASGSPMPKALPQPSASQASVNSAVKDYGSRMHDNMQGSDAVVNARAALHNSTNAQAVNLAPVGQGNAQTYMPQRQFAAQAANGGVQTPYGRISVAPPIPPIKALPIR